MSHIFISYSKKNSDYAYALADFLQAQGFNIWIDRVGIEYGVGWWDAIEKGLEGCGAFIVIMSPESRASKWVQREVFIVLDKKPTFPILLNGDNWKVFVLTQYFDARNDSLPDDNFLRRLGEKVTRTRKPGTDKSTLISEKQPAPTSSFDIDEAIADFGRAYRRKQWQQALKILARIQSSNEDPTPFDPDDFQQKVQAQIEAEQRQREQAEFEAERHKLYQRILALADFDTADSVWKALNNFWQTFPDYDPDNLAEQVRPQPKITFPTNPVEQKILPDPFEWIEIPAGMVPIEDASQDRGTKGGHYSVFAFMIAKYPVTVAQYEAFVEDDGYENLEFWTRGGWDWKQENKIAAPRYWEDSKYRKLDHPVVGVLWHEAYAYCQWLARKSEQPITLPTEQEWQRAAQGDDGRWYPWGNEFDSTRCNFNSQGTTPVKQYLSGESPFGVIDMSGNVWEWCLTEWGTDSQNPNGESMRLFRGGSWRHSDAERLSVAYRDWSSPDFRSINNGFRCACFL